jgi:hypothetical protein
MVEQAMSSTFEGKIYRPVSSWERVSKQRAFLDTLYRTFSDTPERPTC